MRKTFLRTEDMHKKYSNTLANPDFFLNSSTVVDILSNEKYEWEHWRIISNKFPYDAIAEEHHMLIPKRQVARESDLTVTECMELHFVKNQVVDVYDMISLNFPNQQSQPHWLHYHLIKLKIK